MTLRQRRTGLAAILAAGLVLCAVLVRFPPGSYGFYPVCPIYAWTGLLCPGCGGTRAIAALLRGNFAEAWRWNALLVSLVPFGLGYWVVMGWRVWFRDARWVVVPKGMWVGVGVVAVGFMVWRNLG